MGVRLQVPAVGSRYGLCNPAGAEGLPCSSQARVSEKRAICGFWHILSSGLKSFLHGVFYLTQRNK